MRYSTRVSARAQGAARRRRIARAPRQTSARVAGGGTARRRLRMLGRGRASTQTGSSISVGAVNMRLEHDGWHWVNHEKPGEVNELTVEFLTEALA
jgi:hypothetical protein